MWKYRKAEPQHENIPDDRNSLAAPSLASPSMERPELSGYVNKNGVPNSVYVASGNADEEGPKNDRNRRRLELWIDFISDMSFLFGTLMYLWLNASKSKDVLLPNKNEGEISNKPGWVLEDTLISEDFSFYMVFGILIGALMLAAGAFRLYTSRSRSDRVPYAFMVLASAFAITSSSLVRKYPSWSKACFCISMHLFALQAATLILWRVSRFQSSSRMNRIGISIRIFADFLFLLSTLGGITLSYWYLFDAVDTLSFSHEYLEIGAAGLWCLSSFVYLSQTFCELVCRGKTNNGNKNVSKVDEKKGRQKSLPQEDTQSTDDCVEKPSKDEEAIQAIQEKIRARANSNDLLSDYETDDFRSGDEEQSGFSSWTDGSGPSNEDLVARSTLDSIFGVSTGLSYTSNELSYAASF